MFKFGLLLRHDAGTIYIETTAQDSEQAKRQILDFEGASESAIIRLDCLGQVEGN